MKNEDETELNIEKSSHIKKLKNNILNDENIDVKQN